MPGELRQLCVLVVDDDEALAGGLAWALSEKGLRVAVVTRGQAVPEMIPAIRPDALVLDISLPDLNGITVARVVRARWPALPIIFTTRHDNEGETRRALSLPRTLMMRKPFDTETLVAAIRSVL